MIHEVAILSPEPGAGHESRWWRHVAEGERTLCGIELGGDVPGGARPDIQAEADAAPLCASCSAIAAGRAA